MSVASNIHVGILAIQGEVDAHAAIVQTLGVTCKRVCTPSELSDISGLIIPGGESTTLLKFLQRNDFLEAIKTFHRLGGALFGTCAGAILLATNVEPKQLSLHILPINIERNAYGRQLSSTIKQGEYFADGSVCECVFIRAPKITQLSEGVIPLVQCDNQVVAVTGNRCIASTYHPELSNDTKLHEMFVKMCGEKEEI